MMPNPQQQLRQNRIVYAAFSGLIEDGSAERFIQTLSQLTDPRAMVDSVHLLLNSPGGQISEGVTIYNFLRAYPLPLTIYNCGTVASAGVLAFLGAKNRKTSVHATFMIHKAQIKFEYPIPASDVRGATRLLELDDSRTEAIFREAGINFTEQHWTDFGNNKDIILNPQEALAVGLVQVICEFSPPPRSPLIPI